MNGIILSTVGNLTGDPELRYTQSGLAVANFTVAVTERIHDRQTNTWKDGAATFLRCSVWREYAEHVASSLTKGTRVLVTGNLKQREYTTREGEKRTSYELEVDEIGPSLRYATADVVRANSGGTRGASTASAPADEPWSTAQPGNGGDGWSSPGNYNDDAPF